MKTEMAVMWWTGVIAVATIANFLIAWWYAVSTRRLLLAGFVETVCHLYNVQRVRQ